MAKMAGALNWMLPALVRRCMATSAAASASTATTVTRDPPGLSEDDVSRIYCAPNSEIKTVFPRGLPKSFTTQIDCFRKTCWILRAQSYKIISRLRKEGNDQHNFLIYGDTGCGKTICLSQVVHWCWKAGWLLLHVPGVSFWAHSRKELHPSQRYPGTYDQPHEATVWLKNFRAVNAGVIKNLRLSKGRSWTKREESEKGEEFGKVIERGLHKPVIATDVVGVILEELLKEHARQSTEQGEQKSLKLLLAVDEANAFYNPCAATIKKFEHVEPHELNLMRYFSNLIPASKFPGARVLALSQSKTFKQYAPTSSPEDLMGKEGMEAITGYHQMKVTNFSHTEVLNLLNYYKEQNWITRGPFSTVNQEVWHLSGGNPAEIYKLSYML